MLLGCPDGNGRNETNVTYFYFYFFRWNKNNETRKNIKEMGENDTEQKENGFAEEKGKRGRKFGETRKSEIKDGKKEMEKKKNRAIFYIFLSLK